MGGMTDARQNENRKREKPKGVGRRLREKLSSEGDNRTLEQRWVGFIQMELPNHDDQERKNGRRVVCFGVTFGVRRTIFLFRGWLVPQLARSRSPSRHTYLCTVSFLFPRYGLLPSKNTPPSWYLSSSSHSHSQNNFARSEKKRQRRGIM